MCLLCCRELPARRKHTGKMFMGGILASCSPGLYDQSSECVESWEGKQKIPRARGACRVGWSKTAFSPFGLGAGVMHHLPSASSYSVSFVSWARTGACLAWHSVPVGYRMACTFYQSSWLTGSSRRGRLSLESHRGHGCCCPLWPELHCRQWGHCSLLSQLGLRRV